MILHCLFNEKFHKNKCIIDPQKKAGNTEATKGWSATWAAFSHSGGVLVKLNKVS